MVIFLLSTQIDLVPLINTINRSGRGHRTADGNRSMTIPQISCQSTPLNPFVRVSIPFPFQELFKGPRQISKMLLRKLLANRCLHWSGYRSPVLCKTNYCRGTRAIEEKDGWNIDEVNSFYLRHLPAGSVQLPFHASARGLTVHVTLFG